VSRTAPVPKNHRFYLPWSSTHAYCHCGDATTDFQHSFSMSFGRRMSAMSPLETL
jgi:hypothetical protein